ncbi:MAG: DUF554 domain-containing protein [Treponemataceae bacterium]|nr:DUF554 domain-containing protein [Treponemataceae bacterium]
MIAVFVNCATVIVGSLLGCLFARKITKSFSDVVSTGAGIISLVLGIQMTLEYKSVICLALCLILGGLLGTLINIDGAILKLGSKLEGLVSRKKQDTAADGQAVKAGASETSSDSDTSAGNGDSNSQKNFAYAFLNASVLFCVGSMAILGSFQAGIDHNYTLIFTKSILDGFMAIVFAASMGIGTLFSFIAILVYQGALTLLSSFIAPYISELMLTELTACGGAMIIMIGFNLLSLKKIKTANFLPGLLFVVLYVIVQRFLPLP